MRSIGVVAVGERYTRTRKSRIEPVPPGTPPKFVGGPHLKNAFVFPGAANRFGGVDVTVHAVAVSERVFRLGPGSWVSDPTCAESVRLIGPFLSDAFALTFTRMCLL